MRIKRWVAAAAIGMAAALLASCGGGGNDPYPPGTGGGTTTPQAADLILEVTPTNLANSGSDTATATVTAVDANRHALSKVDVNVTVDGQGVVTGGVISTDDSGQGTATISIGDDKSNRVLTVTAASGSIKKSKSVQVFGASLTGTLVPAVVSPGQKGAVQYRLLDQAGNPMTASDIDVTATGLTPDSATGKTGLNGEFTFKYTAPSAVGNYDISATAGGTADTQTLQVQKASTVPVVTQAIESASVSASPSVVGVNTAGSSSNRSEIRALFLGKKNRPIPNVRVRFDLDGNKNSIGGSFTTGNTTLYSDSNGVVTTSYVPADVSSPTNGLTVRACYGLSDTDPGLLNCTNEAKTTLTVTDAPLGVSIGTNELIINNELTYTKKLVVQVVDAAGVAKPDINISVSLDLPRYRKGRYVKGTTSWVKANGGFDSKVCANEDKNRNGVLEAGEDVNGDNRLEPGKSDVSVALLQSKTQADGTATLQITYPKNFATWVDAKITATASGISGTEGRASFQFSPVPALASAFTTLDATPAFVLSPYGDAASCTDPN